MTSSTLEKGLRVEMYGDHRLRLLKTVALLLIVFVSYTFVATLVQISRAYANNKPIVVNRHAIIYPGWHMLSLSGGGNSESTSREKEVKKERNDGGLPTLPLENNHQGVAEANVASTVNPKTGSSGDVAEGPLKEKEDTTTTTTTSSPSGENKGGQGSNSKESVPTTLSSGGEEGKSETATTEEEMKEEEAVTTPPSVRNNEDLVKGIYPSSRFTIIPDAARSTAHMIVTSVPTKMTSRPSDEMMTKFKTQYEASVAPRSESIRAAELRTIEQPAAENVSTPRSDKVPPTTDMRVEPSGGRSARVLTSIFDSKTTATNPPTSVKAI